jgi:L-methionine (R)-S-oxide reductase
MKYENYLSQLSTLIEQEENAARALQQICSKIQQDLDHYDWVGFYFMHHESKKLHLGPYAGKATDHTIINFGSGICGQVALSGETYLSDDVAAEENYIACSIDVKSEIVVPLFLKNELIAQIDIDSNISHAFTQEDNAFLKTLNKMLADRYGEDLKNIVAF